MGKLQGKIPNAKRVVFWLKFSYNISGREVYIKNARKNDNKVIDTRGVKVWIGIFWSI